MPRSHSPSARQPHASDSRRRSRSRSANIHHEKRERRSRSRERSRDRDRHHKSKHHRRDRSSSRHRDRRRSRSPSRDDRRHERKRGGERDEVDRHGTRMDQSSHAPVDTVRVALAPVAPPLAAKASADGSKDDITDRAARIFGYTAENNPFGDPNLTQTFVWKKKADKDIGSGAASAAPSREELDRRREELLDEVERAKARRSRRESEREEMDRLRAEESRLKDAAQYREWEARDDEFHLHQARQKAIIRLRDRRGSPLDVLLFNFLVHDTAEALAGPGGDSRGLLRDTFLRCAVSRTDPTDLLQSLDGVQLARLCEDVRVLADLESAAASAAGVSEGEGAGGRGGSKRPQVGGAGTVPLMSTYSDLWALLLPVAEDELRRCRLREAGIAVGKSIHSLRAVEDEVDAMFAGKTEVDVDAMEADIQALMSGGVGHGAPVGTVSVGLARGSAVDTDYWHGVLQQLRVARTRAALRRLHETQTLERLGQVDRLQYAWEGGEGGERARALTRVQSAREAAAAGGAPSTVVQRGTASAGAPTDGQHNLFADADRSLGSVSAGDAAGAGERRRLIEARVAALQAQGSWVEGTDHDAVSGGGGVDRDKGSEGAAAGAGEGEGEEDFAEEADVNIAPLSHGSATETALLADKYKPRKPRYFNRVKTGYDWNQYNKTHYDKDNPPPKTVQGYKFTLFYPDLMDRSRTPSFALSAADTPEYVIIRFQAGPPYEDVAFKIVNREWEYSRKNGFRCVFDRGVLQLHFNFKRYRYRK